MDVITNAAKGGIQPNAEQPSRTHRPVVNRRWRFLRKDKLERIDHTTEDGDEYSKRGIS